MPRNHISGSYFSRIRGAKRLVGPLIATELVRVALCPPGDTRRRATRLTLGSVRQSIEVMQALIY
jgi:hypothetical protein